MARSPDLGEDYTIRYPLVKPEFINVFVMHEMTPRTHIQAATLLQQEPLTLQTASALVDFVYDHHSKYYAQDSAQLLQNLQGKSEERVKREIKEAAQEGMTGRVAKLSRAAEQLFPDFKTSRLELAGLFKEAYLAAANQPHSDAVLEDPEQYEGDRIAILQLKTCATLLEAAETTLSTPSQ